MKMISMIGAIVVTLALISYSIGIISEQRKSLVTKSILTFITAGIVLDISATICMIIGSYNSIFDLTLHGVLGYSSLTAMIIDAFLLWKFYLANGDSVKVNRGLHLYSRVAYTWWVLAYITGSMLVQMK